jgi:hypothetical protein
MSQLYSTEDLLRILDHERKACMNGQRLSLAVQPSGNPAIDFFLKTDGIRGFTAYQQFRSTVHEYQRSQQVSGIVWQTIVVAGKLLHFPKVDSQLIALANDLEILAAAKVEIYNFWQAVTADLELYLSLHGGKLYQSIAPVDVERIVQRSEWLSLQQQGKPPNLELILQLGWGQPEEAAYRREFPESGSEYVHAVSPGSRPIG